MKTKLFTLLVATMFATQCLCVDRTNIDGILYFLFETELTARVTYDYSQATGKVYPFYKGDIKIPEFVNYNGKTYSVTEIGYQAFYYNETKYIPYGEETITSISIPNSITSIGDYAFENCFKLTSIIIPNSVTSIGTSVIIRCSGLVNISAPATIFDETEEQNWSLYTKIAQTITVTSGKLTENAFAVINRNYKTLKTLDIENAENTELSDEAVKGFYNLETIKLPKNLTKINYMAMAECMALKEVNIPSSVTEIGDRAFENCRSMKTLTFGGGSAMKTAEESQLQRIGNWSFYNCHELQNLEIPEGVTEIGLAAFYGCTYLQNLTLPSTLRTIGDNTFAKCEKLAGLRCAAEVPPTIDAKTFEDVDRTIPVIVPQGSLKAYKEDMYWNEFINLKEETTDAKEIPAEFENVSVTNGTVIYSGNEPFSIHNLNGQDVTNLNGSLNGIHVITIGTASQNMLIK